jgi:hypothetical protein
MTMTDENQDKPKIIVDDDWKAQAQAEKEKLATEAKEKAAAETTDETAQGPAGPREIPPADFSMMVNSIAMQAMMTLGGTEDPKTKKRYLDLELAKFHIDTLGVLQEKTKGNLSDEENALLDRVLHELRMGFVHVSQNAKQATPEDIEALKKVQQKE